MKEASFFKRFDYLGCELTIYYENSKRVKTGFGGFISIIISIIFVTLIYSFGQDFFKRKNPSFIKSTISLSTVPFFTVTNKNFSIGFRIEDSNFNTFYQPEQLDTKFFLTEYIRNTTTGELVGNSLDIFVAPCNKSDFPDNSNVDFEGLLCPKLDNTVLGGSSAEERLILLEVFVLVCIEGKISSRGLPCSSTKEVEKLLDENYFYFTMYVPKTIVNSEDYHNGISTMLTAEYFNINKHTRKYMDMFFEESVLDTDYGWLIKDIRRSSVLGITRTNNQMDFVFDQLTNEYSLLAGVGINFDNQQEKYYREYPKAQNLAAQVGGILKIFLEIGYFVVGIYNTNYCQLSLSDFLINHSKSSKSMENYKHDERRGNVILKEMNQLIKCEPNINYSSQSVLKNNNNNNNNMSSSNVVNLSNNKSETDKIKFNSNLLINSSNLINNETDNITNTLFLKNNNIEGKVSKFRALSNKNLHISNLNSKSNDNNKNNNNNSIYFKENCAYEKDFDLKVSIFY
jgi:hypothetical protein